MASLASSYAKHDALARELDAEMTNNTEWATQGTHEVAMSDEMRALEQRREELVPLPALGSHVMVDGLRKAPAFNGATGVVVSGALGGHRVAVELRGPGKKRGTRLRVKAANLSECFMEPKATAAELLDGRCGPAGDALWVGDCTAAAVASSGFADVPALLRLGYGRAAAEGLVDAAAAAGWPRAATHVVLCAPELFGLAGGEGKTVVERDADADLGAAAEAVRTLQKQNHTVAVCGVEGKDRAPAVALVALVYEGRTVADAWAAVAAGRPTARLSAKRAVAVAAAVAATPGADARAGLLALCPALDAARLDAALAA